MEGRRERERSGETTEANTWMKEIQEKWSKDNSVWTQIANLVFLLLSDTAYVRVFISDVNDNKPVFEQSVYEVDVDEDADVGSTILTVSANDEDEGRWRWGWRVEQYAYL